MRRQIVFVLMAVALVGLPSRLRAGWKGEWIECMDPDYYAYVGPVGPITPMPKTSWTSTADAGATGNTDEADAWADVSADAYADGRYPVAENFEYGPGDCQLETSGNASAEGESCWSATWEGTPGPSYCDAIQLRERVYVNWLLFMDADNGDLSDGSASIEVFAKAVVFLDNNRDEKSVKLDGTSTCTESASWAPGITVGVGPEGPYGELSWADPAWWDDDCYDRNSKEDEFEANMTADFSVTLRAVANVNDATASNNAMHAHAYVYASAGK